MSKRVYKRDKIGRFAKVNTLTPKNEVNSQLFHINIYLFGAREEYANYDNEKLIKSINSHKKRIIEHEDKIKNPQKYVSSWETHREEYKMGLIKRWKKEIENFQYQIKMAEETLNGRK